MDKVIFDREWNSGDIFKFALISDAHIQPNGENKELKKALDRCVLENISIIFNGDLADFITVKDPRYNKATDKAVMAGIINEQIEAVVEFLTPYVDQIEMIGIGNHEDVLIKHYGIDALRFVLRDLNRIRKDLELDPIVYGSYRGIMRYAFQYAKGSRRKTLDIARHHGGGGNAPVTKGVIDLARFMGGFLADVYWIGHKHKDSQAGSPIVYMNEAGNLCQRKRRGIMTPGFQKPFHIDNFSETGGDCSFEDHFYDTNPTGWGLLVVRPYHNSKNDMDLDWTITLID